MSTPKISLDVVKVRGVYSWFYNARNKFNTIFCSKPNSLIRGSSYGKFLGILGVWKNYAPSSHIRYKSYYEFNKNLTMDVRGGSINLHTPKVLKNLSLIRHPIIGLAFF